MGARYIWNRYTAVQQQAYRTRYRETSEKMSNPSYVDVNLDVGDEFTIGKSYYFSEITGSYSLRDTVTYIFVSDYHSDFDTGYMVMTSGHMYYGTIGFLYGTFRILSATDYYYESYQQLYYYYIQGTYLDQRSNASSGYYPSNDEDGGYYYVRQGSDQVDPTAVTVPDDIDDGTTIQISITPNTGKTFGGTISYTYQYRYDGGSWQTLSTTTATTVSLAVPKGQYSTLEVRVRAQDDMGFTSSTWVSSGVKTIIANQPPTAPGISVENVYIGNELEVTLTAAMDPGAKRDKHDLL